MNRPLTLGFGVLIGLWPLVAAPQSLPEQVRRFGSIEQVVQRDFQPAEFSDIAGRAQLIAEVVVTRTTSALTADQEQVYTDATVRLTRVWKPDGQSPPAPRGVIVVRQPGGVVATQQGRYVTCYESDFPVLKEGEEYILFLRRDPRSSTYATQYGSQGAFRITAADVEQVSRVVGTWNRRHRKMFLADFRRLLADAAGTQNAIVLSR